MKSDDQDRVPAIVCSPFPAIAILLIAVAVFVAASRYGEVAGQAPLLVAGLLVVLGLFDLGSRTKMPLKDFFVKFWGADFKNREMKFTPTLTREIAVLGWVIGCTAGMLLIGILPTIPLFCFFYILIEAKRSWIESALITAAFLGLVYFVFEYLLNYELYRGAFFTKQGFSGW